MCLCKKCGRELDMYRVHGYGGQRKCKNCGRRLWKTGYYVTKFENRKPEEGQA